MDTLHLTHHVLGALATVRNSVVPVYTTAVSSMDLNNKKTFESFEEVCKFLMDFCNDKSVHTISNRHALMHADSGKPYDLNHFWGDEKKGVWIECENDSTIGFPVHLHQFMGFAYSMCNFIWPSYEELSRTIENLIIQWLDDDDDEVDGAAVDDVKDGASGEAYLRRLYLVLKKQGMVSSNVFSSFFGRHQQCLYGCVCFHLLLFAIYSGDRANMPNVDWVNHVVLNGGCCKVIGKESLGSME